LAKGDINLGAVVLAIIKSKGDHGAFTDEITEALLKLQSSLVSEPISARPGPVGPESERVRNIVSSFVVRGFVKDFSPYSIMPDGEEWLNSRLKETFSRKTDVESFWSLIKQSIS
jgi:hypothetical protein